MLPLLIVLGLLAVWLAWTWNRLVALRAATRAAWAWRAYVTAARTGEPRALEVRYESLVGEPDRAASAIAEHLGVDPALLAGRLGRAHDRSVGRFRSDLSEEQLADVDREAGALLSELGYTS